MTHGHYRNGKKSPTYVTWDSMIARCHRPTHPRYADYGGRGIRVCDRWRGADGFIHFLADVGVRPAGLTIDRVNVDDDYRPGNVRWATLQQQRWNRRDMIHVAEAYAHDQRVEVAETAAAGMPF